MKRKLNRISFMFLSAAAAMGLASCDSTQKEREAQITNKVDTVLRDNYGYSNTQLISADVAKTGFEFAVKLNCVTKTEKDETAYVAVGYEVPSENFVNLKKRSDANSVYDVLDYVVDNCEIANITTTPIANIIETNDTFLKNTPSPFKDYRIRDAVITNISPAKFDEEKGEVSFTVKSVIDVGKFSINPGLGIGWGFRGGFGLGIGFFPHEQEGKFTTQDKYTVSVSKEQMAQIKEDEKVVYTIATDAINSKTNNITGERLNVCEATYDTAASVLSFNMQEAVDEMSR